jgi:uncharacterized membrane protein
MQGVGCAIQFQRALRLSILSVLSLGPFNHPLGISGQPVIKLIGIIVIATGFGLRLNTLLVVMASGIITGMVSGMSFNAVMGEFGRLFVANRYVTLPAVMMLPIVGLLERYGLRERAETLIRRSAAATAGRVILIYSTARQVSIALGVNVGGHAGAVRPLVAPLAEGAARVRHGDLSKATVERIRALAAAAENVGSFFGEDIFIAIGAILLMKGFFEDLKIEVSSWAMALWGIPTAVAAFALMGWRTRVLDRQIARDATGAAGAPKTGNA